MTGSTATTIITGWSTLPAALEPWRAAWAALTGQSVHLFDFHPYGTNLGIFPPFGHLPSPYAQALRETLGTHPQTLVGWSTGALIALETAHFWPDAVQSLYLVSATACFCAKPGYPCGTERTHLRVMKRQLASKNPQRVLELFWQQTLAPTTIETLDSLSAQRCTAAGTQAQQIPVPALQAGLTYLEWADLRDWCPSISQPTYLWHGAADAVIPVAAAQALAAALPRATIQIDPHQGHGWPLTDPQGLARRMHALLQ